MFLPVKPENRYQKSGTPVLKHKAKTGGLFQLHPDKISKGNGLIEKGGKVSQINPK